MQIFKIPKYLSNLQHFEMTNLLVPAIFSNVQTDFFFYFFSFYSLII